MWYYKYDGLGRRISKQCPEKRISVEYLWDGDQLAYSITERNGKLESERHSVFNGWHLIAQQDYYSEFHQTPDGNKTEWKHQTHYAVTQPNGQVLSLFNPEGKTGWYKPQTTLWGLDLDFDRYASPKPLNPNLLFAGQYFDEESGLAYNRFRYYDPETASYLCSDPIGLEGGETPYAYVQNPWDWVDPFGLSSCELAKAMEKAGTKRPLNSAAHHIVPETAKDAQIARDILAKHNIDINSAVNGVFLPNKNNTDALSGILHNGRHPNKYLNAINHRLSRADERGKNAVLQELENIKNILSNAPRNSDWRNIL